jgi:alpha-mannosidase
MYPDWLADEGEHHFIYALYPHPGDWTESDVIAEAQALNSPLVAIPAGADVMDSAGFVTVDGTELALGALKPAFDGNGLILRMYEPHGRRGPVRLTFASAVHVVTRVDLLEEPADGAEITVPMREFKEVPGVQDGLF